MKLYTNIRSSHEKTYARRGAWNEFNTLFPRLHVNPKFITLIKCFTKKKQGKTNLPLSCSKFPALFFPRLKNKSPFPKKNNLIKIHSPKTPPFFKLLKALWPTSSLSDKNGQFIIFFLKNSYFLIISTTSNFVRGAKFDFEVLGGDGCGIQGRRRWNLCFERYK